MPNGVVGGHDGPLWDSDPGPTLKRRRRQKAEEQMSDELTVDHDDSAAVQTAAAQSVIERPEQDQRLAAKSGADHIADHAVAIFGRAAAAMIERIHELRAQLDALESTITEDSEHAAKVVRNLMAMTEQTGQAAAVIQNALTDMRAQRARLVARTTVS